MTTNATAATEKPKRTRAKPAPPPATPPYTEAEFARLRARAELIDREWQTEGIKGGFLKYPGLKAYEGILHRLLIEQTAELRFALADIANEANIATSTTSLALDRLQECGLIERGPRFVRLVLRLPDHD